MGAMKDTNLGISIAVAVAIHNIPEGIAVSTPIFYATGNKKKAFFYSVLSGLAEPVGALFGYILLRNFLSDVLLGTVFAFIAGIMVFISFDQLLPAAQKFGSHHRALYGLIAGMFVMAVSLLIGA
jgi:ZIP family zinc transporter